MKKVGIISLYNNSYNYGGVLQAFALCELIKEYGYDATQICYFRRKKATTKIQKIKNKKITFLIRRVFEKIETKVCDSSLDKGLLKGRRDSFDLFKKKYIKDTKKIYDNKSIIELVDDFDAFVCGSDQVWNPNIVDDAYLLNFVPDNKVRFSYAASVAAKISKDMYPLYHDALQRLDAVSIRESNMQNELARISGREVEWVLDPTLLLKKEQWDKIISSVEIKEPYILCYFLGANKKIRKLAEKYAEKKKCIIVNLPYVGNVHKLYDKSFGDIQKYDVGPDSFLYLIKNAQCVFTDSFHAVVFSHVFHKSFFATQRTGYERSENRIMSLLNISGLEERFLNTNDRKLLDKLLRMPDPDYSLVEKRMQDRKELSLKYLKSCLERINKI